MNANATQSKDEKGLRTLKKVNTWESMKERLEPERNSKAPSKIKTNLATDSEFENVNAKAKNETESKSFLEFVQA